MEYGWMMVRTLFVLGAVCALAYGLLRWGLRRFVPHGGDDGQGRLAVVDRLGVAPKQSILVVRVGERHLLLGSSEAGLQYLTDLDEPKAIDEPGDEGLHNHGDPVQLGVVDDQSPLEQSL